MFGKGKNKIRVVERKLYEVRIFGPPYYSLLRALGTYVILLGLFLCFSENCHVLCRFVSSRDIWPNGTQQPTHAAYVKS